MSRWREQRGEKEGCERSSTKRFHRRSWRPKDGWEILNPKKKRSAVQQYSGKGASCYGCTHCSRPVMVLLCYYCRAVQAQNNTAVTLDACPRVRRVYFENALKPAPLTLFRVHASQPIGFPPRTASNLAVEPELPSTTDLKSCISLQ